jgi:multiple sugar transport system ATP-binding protein
MASIQLDGVNKVYPNGFAAVHDLTLNVDDGEFLVVVGPSGCGKTTALRMIAGLETVTSGTVSVGGQVVNDVSPRDRDIAMIFQSYALYPNMNVAQNIGFALKMRHLPKAEIEKRVKSAAAVLGITDWLDRKPSQLSGGQRQRVAMGRAIVREPKAFLMDEPLSNLDAKLRVQMRTEVARVQRRIGVATVYVTHDQTEAMTLGHRVAVLRGGVLQQCDSPQILYDRPDNVFVAGFIGSPAMNLFSGVLNDDVTSLKVGSQIFALDDGLVLRRPGIKRYGNRPVVVGLRPEDLTVESSDSSLIPFEGQVELVEALGAEVLVHFSADASIYFTDPTTGAADDDGSLPGEQTGLIARLEPRFLVRPGDRVSFRFAADRLEFFDPDTEAAIWE